MKAYFTRLFNYDRHASLLISDAIMQAGKPDKAARLVAHMLAAQVVWLNRCKGLTPPANVLWPDWPAETFEQIINENHDNWTTYLDGLVANDFDVPVSYKNLKGEPFENRLCDILAHVINHGTHHRAQAGQHLIAAGMDKLPITDYIFYLR